jgi:hypothetical protein
MIWKAEDMANYITALHINTETVESGTQGRSLSPKRLKHEAVLLTIKTATIGVSWRSPPRQGHPQRPDYRTAVKMKIVEKETICSLKQELNNAEGLIHPTLTKF